jgi:3-hydroxybutyryl-CoA dehydrogenase
MKIAVIANNELKEEWLYKGFNADIEIIWNDVAAEADVYFDLLFERNGASFNNISYKPVFVNAVITTCKELPDNYIRLNAWNGFLKRNIIEVAGINKEAVLKEVMNALGWNYQLTADEPGFIAARIIAMIINEAYFALQDNVSTKEAIDIAMKLGTNYPFGPFEWCNKLGLPNVYLLLKTLSINDNRYILSEKLTEELKSIA